MDELSLLKEYDKLIKYTANRCSRIYLERRADYGKEDFHSEAVIAAIKAIRSWRDDGRSKLSTYISTCIMNRMRDIHKSFARHGDPVHVTDTDLIDKSYSVRQDMNIALVLNEYEIEIVDLMTKEVNRRELIEHHRRRMNCATLTDAKGSLKVCLSRIRRKLTSNETSRSI